MNKFESLQRFKIDEIFLEDRCSPKDQYILGSSEATGANKIVNGENSNWQLPRATAAKGISGPSSSSNGQRGSNVT